MTVSSRFVKLLAGVGALAAHGAVAMVLSLPDPIEVEGGAGAAEVQLGTGFADMAVGSLQARPADLAEQAKPVETLAAVTPPKDAPRAEASPTRPVQPQHATRPADEAAPRAPVKATDPARNTPMIAETAPMERPENVPVEPSAVAEPERLAALEPQTAPSPSPQRLTAEPAREQGAVTTSLRPKPRTPEVEQTARDAHPKPRPKPQRQAAQGNADRNMRAGDAAGTETAKAHSKGSGGTTNAAGNAAVSNYPGQVMRKLSRAGKPRVNARGQAVVAFTVAANGGLQAVSLARSSGSSALDQAALRLVQNAAPFPQPPSGARRSFSIGIQGR